MSGPIITRRSEFRRVALRRTRPIDAVTVLSLYVVVMMVVPSLARFAPAGSIGAPSTMLAILIFFWWLWDQAHRSVPGPQDPQWVRRFALLLLVVMLLVYAFSSLRPMPLDEVSPAASGILQFLALIGLTLTASDGIRDRERFHALVRRMTVLGVAVGVLAIVQFFTHQQWVGRFVPPPLTMDAGEGALGVRGAFTRPSGTSVHPLEFGAVIAMLIPLAIVRARHASGSRIRPWVGVAILMIAAVVSLSRSALLCTAVALVIVSWGWSVREKLLAAGIGVLGLGFVTLMIPGLVGTLRGLFLGSGSDSSVQSRTGSFSYAFQMVERFPLFGRGYGTFLPRYWVLDNGYLQFLVSAGILGMLSLIALFFASMLCARWAARRFIDRADREMSQAILASATAGITAVAFFDLFSFAQAAGSLFLILGMCGAIHRLVKTDPGAQRKDRPTAVADNVRPPSDAMVLAK